MRKHTAGETPEGGRPRGSKSRRHETGRTGVSVTGENLEISVGKATQTAGIKKIRRGTGKKAEEAVKGRKGAPGTSEKEPRDPRRGGKPRNKAAAAKPQAVAEPVAAPGAVEGAIPPPATTPQQPATRETLNELTESDLKIFQEILNKDFTNYEKLTHLTRNVAEALAEYRGDATLSLNGLTSISTEAAEALAEYKGYALHLNGLTSISVEAAKALAEYKGTLWTTDKIRTMIKEAVAPAAQAPVTRPPVTPAVPAVETEPSTADPSPQIGVDGIAKTPAEETLKQPPVPSLPELLIAIKTAETTDEAGKVLEQVKQGFLQAGFSPEVTDNLILSDKSESRVGYKRGEGEIYSVNFRNDYIVFDIIIVFEKNEIVLDYCIYIGKTYTTSDIDLNISNSEERYKSVLVLKERLGDRIKIDSLYDVSYLYGISYGICWIHWCWDYKTFRVAPSASEYSTPDFNVETITAEEIDAELAKFKDADAAAASAKPKTSQAEQLQNEVDRFKERLMELNFNPDSVKGIEYNESSYTKLIYRSEATGKKFEVIYIIEDKPPFSLTISRNGKDMLIESNTTPEDIDKYYKTRWEKIKGLFSRKKEVSPRGPETAATQPEGTAKAGSTAPSPEVAAVPAEEAVTPAVAAPETKPPVTPVKETKPPPVPPPQVIADGIAKTPIEEAFFDSGEGRSARRQPPQPAGEKPQQPPPPYTAVPAQGEPPHIDIAQPPSTDEPPLSPFDKEEKPDDYFTPTGRITSWVRDHAGLILGICVVSAGVTALYISRDHWQMPWGGKQYECGLKHVASLPEIERLRPVCTNPKGKIDGTPLVMLKTPGTEDCEWQDTNGDGIKDLIKSCRAQLELINTGREPAKTRIRNFKVAQEVGKVELTEVRFK